MKRKRRGRPKKVAAKKPTPDAPVKADEEVFLNFVEQNVDENGVSNEVNNNGAGPFEAAKEFSSSVSPSSSSDGGGSFHPGQDSDSSDEPATGGRITVSVNKRGRPPMSREASVKATNTPAMFGSTVFPSKGKRSKVVSSRGFSSVSQKEVPFVKKPVQDPRYNKPELQACLEVIKKIMQMEEAVSFCSPVDPIAQGIPDYFTVIDTPMDFGTICNNLQNDVKYIKSDDVLKDVEYIWENCSKYNKKGDYIVFLMKRVKKKFMKYWTEAGLRTEIQRRHDGHSHVAPPSVHTVRQSRHEAMSVVDNMVNSYQNQQDRFGTNQPQPRMHQPSYANPYMSHQPQPSTSQIPQYSQFHAGGVSNHTGHSYMPGPPHTAHPMEQERQEPSRPFPPMTNGPTYSQHQQPQLSSRYMWESHQTTSQPQPSQSHFRTDTNNTGNQQSLHPTDYGVTLTHNGYVPRPSMDPMISSVGHPQPQPQLQHRSSSHYQQDLSKLPQASIVPPQPSHPAASVDVSSPGMSPVDGSSRERRYMKRSSAGPGNGVQVVSSLPQQHSAVGQNQPVTSPGSTLEKKRRGRGPTRCHLLDDLPEGHRIYVPFNSRGQPIGPEALKLASFTGSLARDCTLAPLSYLEWSAMPEEVKENMWQMVQTKFVIDSALKKWFLKSLGSKWRNWKAKLKADHYNPHTTDEERLRDCNKRVDPDQWAALIAHWNSEEVQLRSMKNKANRAKQINIHASGSKSFARILEEEKAKRGKELTRSELYILTRTRKDGQPVDDFAAENIEKLKERANRKEQTSGASSDEADTFCEVMGKETGSHVRMYGIGGPTIGELYGRKSSRSGLLEVALEAKNAANEEVGKMMTKMEAMEQKYSSLEAQIAQMNSNMQLLIQKMGGGTGTTSKQVNDNLPEDSLQAQSHSSSSSHAVEVEDEDAV